VEIDRRYGIPGRKPDELIPPTEEERIGANRQSRARLLGEVRERCIDVAFVTGSQYAQIPSALLRRRLRVPCFRFGIRITRIDEYGGCGRGHDLGEDLDPLCLQHVNEQSYARGYCRSVGSNWRLGHILRVIPGRDHNGDSRCSGLGRKPCDSATRRRDDGNLAAHQIGGQR
jgi:hypothetical protein